MNLIKKTAIIIAALALHSCSDALDLQPMDKLDAKRLFASEEGIQVFMANLYSQLPIEDLAWTRNGFNSATINTIGITPSNQTDIAENARRCIEAGTDGFAVINTIMGMAIDIESRRPIIGNNQGAALIFR
jgi:hypothetical protein